LPELALIGSSVLAALLLAGYWLVAAKQHAGWLVMLGANALAIVYYTVLTFPAWRRSRAWPAR